MRRMAMVTAAAMAIGGVALGVGVTGASAHSTMPTVTSVSPAHGPVGGGTLVTVQGSNLFGATSVTFGGASASLVNKSNSRLLVMSPAGTADTSVDIRVTTSVGTSARTNADLFTYVTTPAIQSVTPRVGSTRGGNLVDISGSDFTGVSAVYFGAVAATSFHVLSPNAIAAVSPAASVSTVDVTVVATDGTTPIDPADKYSYVLRVPVVSSVVFDVGNVAGGNSVTITGSGFANGAVVNFGTTPATSVTYVNPTVLTAVAPASATTGIVDVTVITSKGASVINEPVDEYLYTATGP